MTLLSVLVCHVGTRCQTEAVETGPQKSDALRLAVVRIRVTFPHSSCRLAAALTKAFERKQKEAHSTMLEVTLGYRAERHHHAVTAMAWVPAAGASTSADSSPVVGDTLPQAAPSHVLFTASRDSTLRSWTVASPLVRVACFILLVDTHGIARQSLIILSGTLFSTCPLASRSFRRRRARVRRCTATAVG